MKVPVCIRSIASRLTIAGLHEVYHLARRLDIWLGAGRWGPTRGFRDVGLGVLLVVCSSICHVGNHESDTVLEAPDLFTFDFGAQRYPILYTGQPITASQDVKVAGQFRPLFGPNRAVVNPVLPQVRDGRTLVFDKPGEYYLYFNDADDQIVLEAFECHNRFGVVWIPSHTRTFDSSGSCLAHGFGGT